VDSRLDQAIQGAGGPAAGGTGPNISRDVAPRFWGDIRAARVIGLPSVHQCAALIGLGVRTPESHADAAPRRAASSRRARRGCPVLLVLETSTGRTDLLCWSGLGLSILLNTGLLCNPPRHKGVANNGTTSTAVSSTRRTAPDAAAARSTARLAASSRSPQDSADALHSGWSHDHARDHLVKTVPRTNRPNIPSPPLRTPTPSDRKIDSVVSPIN
jgi:hypothetical protein